jgi:hypothetical protein
MTESGATVCVLGKIVGRYLVTWLVCIVLALGVHFWASKRRGSIRGLKIRAERLEKAAMYGPIGVVIFATKATWKVGKRIVESHTILEFWLFGEVITGAILLLIANRTPSPTLAKTLGTIIVVSTALAAILLYRRQ